MVLCACVRCKYRASGHHILTWDVVRVTLVRHLVRPHGRQDVLDALGAPEKVEDCAAQRCTVSTGTALSPGSPPSRGHSLVRYCSTASAEKTVLRGPSTRYIRLKTSHPQSPGEVCRNRMCEEGYESAPSSRPLAPPRSLYRRPRGVARRGGRGPTGGRSGRLMRAPPSPGRPSDCAGTAGSRAAQAPP